jgi:beta-aspartyl-peptidase (threonine type)
MKVVLAKTACDFLAAGQLPQQAADNAIHLLDHRTGGKAGMIILDRTGRVGTAYSTPHMAVAYRDSDTYCIGKIR